MTIARRGLLSVIQTKTSTENPLFSQASMPRSRKRERLRFGTEIIHCRDDVIGEVGGRRKRPDVIRGTEQFASEAARRRNWEMVAKVPLTGICFERLRFVFVATVA